MAVLWHYVNSYNNCNDNNGIKMAKRVFFSFHYEDVKTFRANVVRNHWLTKKDSKDAGFFDASIWEDAKKHGDADVKRLINGNLENTSVTCALIGKDTWSRRWVRYEIMKSYDRENKLFGIHINSIKDKNQIVLPFGKNIFDYLGFIVSSDGSYLTYYEHDGSKWNEYTDLPKKRIYWDKQYWGKSYKLSEWVPVYDWELQKGYDNFSDWVENAK